MKEIILIKLGELVLKGLNRKTFEAALVRNIRHRIDRLGSFDIRLSQSTITIFPKGEADLDEVAEKIGKVFGIAAYSRACVAEKKMDSILPACAEYLSGELNQAATFKVESKRSDKSFPLKSPEISAEVGGFLLEEFPHLRVDVHNPDLVVTVEVRDYGAYIHGSSIPGAGGMPVGTSGKAALLISGGIDSPVAAWSMAKRGLELVPVHFASPPYTSERAEQKVVDLLTKVSEYSGRMILQVVPFAHIQEQIMEKCPEEFFTIIMRRFMMSIAERLANEAGAEALITGESLGQVASQTMRAIACTDAVVNMPVFRPLIGMDKTEIIQISRRIETFDISIQPFEDCCTVFTPKHPRTKPHLRFVEAAEEQLDSAALIQEAVSKVKLIKIGYNHSQE